jgi:hypothetical protein
VQSWIDIITDPHHLFADFLMNVGFEVAFAWVTYLILVKTLTKKLKREKPKGRRAKRSSDIIVR